MDLHFDVELVKTLMQKIFFLWCETYCLQIFCLESTVPTWKVKIYIKCAFFHIPVITSVTWDGLQSHYSTKNRGIMDVILIHYLVLSTKMTVIRDNSSVNGITAFFLPN